MPPACRATPARPPSPACPASTRSPTPTSPSSVCRSTPASPTDPGRGSGRRTSARRPGCCGPIIPRLDVEPFAVAAGGRRRRHRGQPVRHRRGDRAPSSARSDELRAGGTKLVTLGGDHTIALPLLRSLHRDHGPIAVLHFDAHLDTWDTYFGAPFTHGTPFRRASEEGMLDTEHCCTSASAARSTRPTDLDRRPRAPVSGDRHRRRLARRAVAAVIERMRAPPRRRTGLRVDRHRCARPGACAGTGTPEAGGMTSRELLETACETWWA